MRAEPRPPRAPDPTPTPEVRRGIEWEDLKQLAFVIDGETIQLEDGRATVSYGGASEDVYVLQNQMVQGDLDGDGHDDVIAHIALSAAGTGTFHMVVAVIDNGQGGEARLPVWLGDRIVIDSIEVRDGKVEVALFDREPDEPFTVISRHQRLEIDFSGPGASVTHIASQPLAHIPLPGPDRPEIAIQFDPGAIGAIVAGSIEFRQRQVYTAEMAAGQMFTATLEAPLGVWLDVGLGDVEVDSASERPQQVQAELPITGSWQIAVVSAHAGPADYKLSIEALPPGVSLPSPEAEPAEAPRPGVDPTPIPDDSAPVMYFTFDDGPHPVYTPQVLDVLARYDARATFFVVGRLVEAYPNLTQRIFNEGHTLGNHTWNHENLAGLPREQFDDTVGRTQALLGARGASCLRTPYMAMDAFTREWAAGHGLSLAMWDIVPQDWLPRSALTIAQYIVDHARDGAIVLLHDGGGERAETVLGLDVALSELSRQGYRFEPMCV